MAAQLRGPLTSPVSGVERGHDLLLRWFPVDALPDVQLFPEFLRTAVGQLPNSPQHVVRVDIDRAHSSSPAIS